MGYWWRHFSDSEGHIWEKPAYCVTFYTYITVRGTKKTAPFGLEGDFKRYGSVDGQTGALGALALRPAPAITPQ